VVPAVEVGVPVAEVEDGAPALQAHRDASKDNARIHVMNDFILSTPFGG
jgi:hypothetical protein